MSWIVWPEILARLPADRHAVIEASAGTGKTYTLEHLIVREVCAGTPIERLLVVTFTEKATDELRRRVRAELEAVLDRAVLPPAEGATPLTALEVERVRLARDGFERAAISTIHGFCQRVLSDHAFGGGRFLREEVADRETIGERAFHQMMTTAVVRDDALRPWLEALLAAGEPLDALREQLGRALGLPEDRTTPALDLAGIEAAWRGLPVEAAVRELATSDLNEKTRPSRSRIEPGLVALQSRDLAGLLARAEDVLGLAAVNLGNRKLPALSALLARLPPLFERIMPLSTAVTLLFLPVFRGAVQAIKAREGVLDYDDMLHHLAAALRDPARGPGLRAALRDKYTVALIDEFQDTDETQWFIFHHLFGAAPHRMIVIGDPKQAIYGFRGADVETYKSATSALREAGAAFAPLDACYRSAAPLVAAYSGLLSEGVLEEPPPPVRAPAGAPVLHDPGQSAALVLVDLPDANAGRTRLIHGTWIAEEIQRLLRVAHWQDRKEKRRPVQAKDIYVLTYNDVDGRNLGRLLREHGVRVAFYKQDGLFQSSEAKALRDVLAAVSAPSDRSATLRALLTPMFDVPLTHLPFVQPGRSHPALERLAEWSRLGERRQYAQLFADIFDQSGVLRRAAFVGGNERAVTNYLHLAELIIEWISRDPPTLSDVVAWMDRCIAGREAPLGRDGNVQRLEGEVDAVQIMTVHKSKGLEAPVVFLFGGFFRGSGFPPPFAYRRDGARWHELRPTRAQGGAPHVTEAIAGEDEREVGRLSYVAMTRAKGRVYVPTTAKSFRMTGRHHKLAKRARQWIDEAGRRTHAAVVVPPPPAYLELVEAEQGPLIAPWMPPRDQLAPPEALAAQYSKLAGEHAPFEVTSYSRLKKEAEAAHDALDPEATILLGEAPAPPPPELGLFELPPGPETGVFLHQILERAPLASVTGGPSLDTWRARSDVRELVDAALLEHRVAPEHRADAERLVHGALTATLPLDPPLPGLAAAQRVVREMEFLFPRPEARVYVKGYLDVVVEHAGRTWIIDWKSDRLDGYDTASLRQHVEERYRLQVQLYALALARIVGVTDEASHAARFGGVVYVFLRAPGGRTPGIVVERPAWSVLAGWETEVPERAQGRVDARGQGLMFGVSADAPPRARKKGGRR